MIVIIAYDVQQAETVLLTWTPQRLLDEALADTFNALDPRHSAAIRAAALRWVQRAIGELSLRDALLIDPAVGAVVWAGLCAWLAIQRCELPLDDLPPQLLNAPTSSTLLDVATLRAHAPHQSPLAAWLASLDDGLIITIWPDAPTPRAPLPTHLEQLLPPLPPPMALPTVHFEQPTGTRRTLATALALVGVGLIGLPLVIGQTPTEPARLPLALMTLALLIGIKARPIGYLGSLCIWLVANLPGFHHGNLLTLWPAIPLLAAGLLLLMMDRHVRAMWRWLRTKFLSTPSSE